MEMCSSCIINEKLAMGFINHWFTISLTHITVTSHGHHGVSVHSQIYCLFNSLFRLQLRIHKRPTLPVPCEGSHRRLSPSQKHDGVIKRNIFRVTGPLSVNSPHKGPWRWALMFSLICAWTNGWVNNRDAGDLRRHRALYDVTLMVQWCQNAISWLHHDLYWKSRGMCIRNS